MIITRGRILAGLLGLCMAAISVAQTPTAPAAQPRPAVAFPPTPTPKPKEVPLTQEKLDAMLIPTQFLGRTSAVLAIVYNGFRRSHIDPCGCVTHQLGGLDKEAALVKRIDELNIPAIQLDAGGFVRDMPDKKMLTQSKYLLKGLGIIGYDVVNVGFTDLALTPDELKETAEQAGINLVSANITDGSGQLIFDPYAIKEIKLTDGSALKVGVLGVTRPRVLMATAGRPSTVVSGAGTESSRTLTINDPVAAINKYVPELVGKADFIVVLDYDRRVNADKIISAIQDKSQIDVLVMGENSQIQGSVQELEGIQVVSGGYEGRQVGTLYLELKDNNAVSTWNKHIEVLQTIPPVSEITQLIKEAHEASTPGKAPVPGAKTPAAPAKLDLGL